MGEYGEGGIEYRSSASNGGAGGGGGSLIIDRNRTASTTDLNGYDRDVWEVLNLVPVELTGLEVGDWVEVHSHFSFRLNVDESAMLLDVVSVDDDDLAVNSWDSDTDVSGGPIGTAFSSLSVSVAGPGLTVPYGFGTRSGSAVRQITAEDIRGDGSVHIDHLMRLSGASGIYNLDRLYLHARKL